VRIGQKEIVEVTHFILKEEETMNIDTRMLELADEKGDMLKKLFMFASRGNCPSAANANANAEEDPIVIDLTKE
jgi:hypothetical protein